MHKNYIFYFIFHTHTFIMPKVSKRQLQYQAQNVFRRNMHYYNAFDITKIENIKSIKRRIPFKQSISISQKVENSFLNSTAAFSDKLENDIHRFKSRLSCSRERESFSYDSQENYLSKSINKIKGFPLELYPPRRSIIQQSKEPVDQRCFNNFTLTQPDLDHTPDFSKMRGREKIANIQTQSVEPTKVTDLNKISIDLGKKYEDFYHKKSSLNCFVNYKTQDPTEGRVIQTKRREEDIPKTDLKPENISKGLRLSKNFHTGDINHFFNNSGKELPPQLLMKTMKDNENYWINRNTGKYVRPELPFELKILKETAVNKRLKLLQRHQSKKQRAKTEY